MNLLTIKGLIHRHKSCTGFRIWKWGRLNIELWYVPARFAIDPHVHTLMDSEIMFLFGNGILHRWDTRADMWKLVVARLVWPFYLGRKFTIKSYHAHWFSGNNRWPLIFLNIERWHLNTTITSAAVDFQVSTIPTKVN